jgi:hypothetical protein
MTGESKLFIQVHKLDVIEELYHQIFSINGIVDSLLEIVGQVDLEEYINCNKQKYEAKE